MVRKWTSYNSARAWIGGSYSRSLNTQLHEILNEFRKLPGLRFAAAYGSGVFEQATYASEPKTLDFLLAVDDLHAFHNENLKRRDDYPGLVRLLGTKAITSINGVGAGVWFVPKTTIASRPVKYGVLQRNVLLDDLNHWTTFYLAGRLQKPVSVLESDAELDRAMLRNRKSALAAALLLQPESFSELDLLASLVGLSYAGDPRMILGAEDPDKVRSIVDGPGSRDRFKSIYAPLLKEFGLDIQETMCRDTSPHTTQLLLDYLPQWLARTCQDNQGISIPLVLSSALSTRIQYYSTTQSLKGIVTAGLAPSIQYTWRKLSKGLLKQS